MIHKNFSSAYLSFWLTVIFKECLQRATLVALKLSTVVAFYTLNVVATE